MSTEEGTAEQTADRFVEHIASLDSGAKAALRRSLAFKPGTWPGAFPYVEPWVSTRSSWERRVAYLVAGLQAHSRAERFYRDFGAAARALRAATDSDSVEARFLVLLDADEDQIPHRLRQMVSLMNSQGVAPDWAQLRKDLTWWRTEERWVQQRWARAYYAASSSDQAEEVNEAARSSRLESGEEG